MALCLWPNNKAKAAKPNWPKRDIYKSNIIIQTQTIRKMYKITYICIVEKNTKFEHIQKFQTSYEKTIYDNEFYKLLSLHCIFSQSINKEQPYYS